jgi:phage replication O-like protein O
MSKKGFRKIENDVFNAIVQAGLTGAGYQIVLTVIDRTLGFRKGAEYKEKAPISLTYFEQVTGLSRQSVRLAIKQVEKRRIIIVERDSTRKTIYTLNKDTSTWVTRKLNHPSELGNQITPNWETKSPYTRKLALASSMRTKEIYKENRKEKGTGKERGTGDTVSYQCGCKGVGTGVKDTSPPTLQGVELSSSIHPKNIVNQLPSGNQLPPEQPLPLKEVVPVSVSSFNRDTPKIIAWRERYNKATSILGRPPDNDSEIRSALGEF